MSFKTTTISNGQAVSTTDIAIQSVLVTAGAANPAVVTVKANGVTEVILAAAAGTSVAWPQGLGSNDFSFRLQGPITLDLSGVGAFARVQF